MIDIYYETAMKFKEYARYAFDANDYICNESGLEAAYEDGGLKAIEMLKESDEWIIIEPGCEMPEDGQLVLCEFINIHDEVKQAIVFYNRVRRYDSHESDYVDKWFVFPGNGMDIKPITWRQLPKGSKR